MMLDLSQHTCRIGLPSSALQHTIRSLRQGGGGEYRLACRFVHRHRRRHHATTHVGQVGKLQQALHGAVFSQRAMQHRKDNVEMPQRFVLGHQPGRSGLRHEFSRARPGLGLQEQERLLSQQPTPALIDADQRNLVTGRIERGNH